MLQAELFELVNTIEDKFPVECWRIDGVDVWPIIRIHLMNRNVDTAKNMHNGFVKKIFILCRLLLCMFFYRFVDKKHMEKKEHADVLLVASNVERSIELPTGEKVSQNVDAIRHELEQRNISSILLENILDGPLKLPRYTNSNFCISRWASIIFFKNRMGVYKKHECKLPDFEKVGDFITKHSNITQWVSMREIYASVNYINYMSRRFEEMIGKKNIRMAMVVCWYGGNGMALSLACRRKNILCVDIQHGVAGGNMNDSYTKWNAVPYGGFNIMPSYFWSSGEKDVTAIYEWKGNKDGSRAKAFVGGNPAFATYNLFKDILESKWISKLDSIPVNGKKVCLLTLQTGIKIPLWVINAIMKSSETIFWLIRKHPINDEIQNDFIRQIAGLKNVEWKMSSVAPLYVILGNVDCHVTMHSTVVLDAAKYGIKSMVTSTLGRTLFYEEIKEDICYYVDNVEELNENIMKCSARCGAKYYEKLPGINMVEQLLTP